MYKSTGVLAKSLHFQHHGHLNRTHSIPDRQLSFVQFRCTKLSSGFKEVHSCTSMESKTPLQSIVNSDEKGGWESAWLKGVTPWDLGGVHPAVRQLVETGNLPTSGRILVPGCGTGWDAVAMASSERHVTGLDLSEVAIKVARKKAEGTPGEPFVEFIAADFFSYKPKHTFDLALDYTFFCAIDPNMRSAWAKKYSELLSIDGELITIIFPLGNFTGGPPYAMSFELYNEVLSPLGFETITKEKLTSSVRPRLGREMLVRWRRIGTAKI